MPEIAVALKMIVAARRMPSQRLLDTCYGPQSASLRAQVVSYLTGKQVPKSHKEVQWGNFRDLLQRLVGAEGNCIAARESDFEEKAELILRGA